MICGRETSALPSNNKRNESLWRNGVVLSFDLSIAKLKDYFSNSSPQGAYDIIKRFLLNNGFEHKKDSDYVNTNIDKIDTVDFLVDFSEDHKWFPLCVNKMNISPNIETLDITTQLEGLIDEEWKVQKDKENEIKRKKQRIDRER